LSNSIQKYPANIYCKWQTDLANGKQIWQMRKKLQNSNTQFFLKLDYVLKKLMKFNRIFAEFSEPVPFVCYTKFGENEPKKILHSKVKTFGSKNLTLDLEKISSNSRFRTFKLQTRKLAREF